MGKLAIKLGISLVAILYIFIFKIDLGKFIKMVGAVDLRWLFLALSLHAFGYLISGVRWKAIAKELKIKLPLSFFIKSYLVSTFFGFFLPSRFGGDIVRIGDFKGKTISGVSTVFYERIVGLFSLVILGIFSILASPPKVKNLLFFCIFILAIVLLLTFTLLFEPKILLLIPIKGKVGEKIKEVYNSFSGLRSSKLFLKTFGWSLLLQLNVILHYWAIGKSASIKAPLLVYFFLIPTMLILMAIPISFQGIGVRDYFSVSVFPLYGATTEQGFLFASADLFIAIILAAIGFFVYLFRR